MKVLVIGSGGREHALVWKIAQSPRHPEIFCAPGNGGTAGLATNLEIGDHDVEALAAFAQEEGIDLTIVGPEVPLVAGIVDVFENLGLRIFGPTARAAILEGSKAFAKDLMRRNQIPTASYGRFSDMAAALGYLQTVSAPLVVKADGLAAGKGVLICPTLDVARNALQTIMNDRKFGEAGREVVIEEFLEGTEISMLCFTDGQTIVPMVSAKDYKKAGKGDTGLNTGGMGCISPNPIYDGQLEEFCLQRICYPTIRAMAEQDRLFKGVLYVGLILTSEGPCVLEYNARFGDPETQVILPRLKTDLLEIFEAIIDERLHDLQIEWDRQAAATVVLASEGYPEAYEKGFPIVGLDAVGECNVFHAGTRREGEDVLTNGGRVLNVTALGEDVGEALGKVYSAVDHIQFVNRMFRPDIGS